MNKGDRVRIKKGVDLPDIHEALRLDLGTFIRGSDGWAQVQFDDYGYTELPSNRLELNCVRLEDVLSEQDINILKELNNG